MTAIVPVTAVQPSEDFAALHFSRSKSGHVQSMWWSYDWKKYNPSGPYMMGSHFHGLRARSISAFASALSIPANEVLVSVRENPVDGQLEWRCGSQHPVELPQKPALNQVERMLAIEKLVGDVERPAIDI